MRNSDAAPAGSWWLPATVLLACCTPIPSSADGRAVVEIEGRVDGDTYRSPRDLFRVAVPEMRNPFVKEPSAIRDRRTPDDGEEVDFSVLDLGEAHRFGVRPLGDGAELEGVFQGELARWTREWVDTSGRAEPILEEEIRLADGAGRARVYVVESASLLFARRGEGAPVRESALIGVVVVPAPQAGRVLYAVSQFDMPNQGGHYTLETERGRRSLAAEHVRRMRQLVETFRLR